MNLLLTLVAEKLLEQEGKPDDLGLEMDAERYLARAKELMDLAVPLIFSMGSEAVREYPDDEHDWSGPTVGECVRCGMRPQAWTGERCPGRFPA